MSHITSERLYEKTEEQIKKHLLEYKSSPTVWRIFLLLSVFTNYLLSSFTYVFLKDNVDKGTFFSILLLDFIYTIDYILAVVDYIWKIDKFYVTMALSRGKMLLIVDCILVFPSSYIYKFSSGQLFNFFVFLCLRSNVLFRLLHVVIFFKQRWHSMGIDHIRYFGVLFLALFLFWLHTNSCIWYSISELEDKYQLTSERYIVSLYYMLMCFTNRSSGKIVGLNNLQKVFILNCLGFLLVLVTFIATLSFLLNNKYHRKLKLKMKLQKVLVFLQSILMEADDIKQTKTFYETFWKKKGGVYKSSHLTSLDYPLRSEIGVDINRNFFQTSPLFKEKPPAFLRMISNLIKQEFYQTGELIYHRDVVKNKMIFLVAGAIEMLSEEDDQSPLLVLENGTCLGEIALIVSVPAKTSVRASCYSELQVLYRKDFYATVDLFPLVYSSIRNLVLDRIAKAKGKYPLDFDRLALNPFFRENDPTALNKVKDSMDYETNFSFLYRIRKQPPSRNCLIWDPNSLTRRLWEIFIVILTIFMSVTYPYFIVFFKENPSWLTIIDLILIIDIFIILTTAIEERNETLQTCRSIFLKRLTELGFYLDFCSTINTELFYWIFGKNRQFLKINRLLKIHRILKFFHKMENTTETPSFLFFLTKYIFFAFIFTYWCGAAFYLASCPERLCSKDGWISTRLSEKLKHLLTSSYFVLSFLGGSAPDNISPTSLLGTCVASIFICGIFTFCCSVAHLAASWTKIARDFRDSTILKQTRKDIIQRIKKCDIFEHEGLIDNLNQSMQTKIHVQEKMEALTRVPLFRAASLNFLLTLATNAKVVVLPPDEYVIYEGEVLKILYIVMKGYCIRDFEKSRLLMKPLSFFGTLCTFCDVSSLCSVRTVSHVKILYITEEDFWKSAATHPTVTTSFREASKNFDIWDEFDKMQGRSSEITDLDDVVLKGSFINVVRHCKRHNEDYDAPFRELRILRRVKAVMVPFCILPYGNFLKLWLLTRLVVALLIALLTPYHIITQPHDPVLDYVLFATDLVAYLDLYVMMFVGYFNEKNQLVLHPLRTALHYIKGRFTVDFVLCFPWELFATYFTPNKSSPYLRNLIKIVRIGQIYRLPQFFNYATSSNNIIFLFLKYSSLILVVINFWATVIIVDSCKSEDVYSERLLPNISEKYITYCGQGSWIDKTEFGKSNPWPLYISAVYFCTRVLTLCGSGVITPQYPSTVLVIMMMMVCGVFHIGYIFAKIPSVKANCYFSIYKSREMVNELKRFMMQENVDIHLQRQIVKRIQHQWECNKYLPHHELLTELHPVLHQDAASALYEDTLKSAPIFDKVDALFLRVLVGSVRERYHLKQETIYKNEDIVSEICIVEEGMVRIECKSRSVEAYMQRGGVFGNITPDANHKISVDVTALTNVTLLIINSSVFFSLLNNYPFVKHTVHGNLMRRTEFILPTSKSAGDNVEDITPYVCTNGRAEANLNNFLIVCTPWTWFRSVISPDSKVFAILEIYWVSLTYLNSLFALYEFVFQDHTSFLLYFAVCADVTFVLKIIVEMHKTYENRFGHTVASSRKIIHRYFHQRKARRIADIAANLPLYYLAFLAGPFSDFDTYLVFSGLRMITIFRLLYLWEYFQIEGKQLSAAKPLLEIWKALAWATFSVHVLACGWYFCSCPLGFCRGDSWMNGYFPNSSINHTEKTEIYLNCLYVIVALSTKAGSGDVVASTTKEQMFVAFVLISTTFLTAALIGEMWNFLVGSNVAFTKYNNSATGLLRFVRNSDGSDCQTRKLSRYVEWCWKSNRGNQMPVAFSYLHSTTLSELMYETYGDRLKTSYIFSEVEESFARQLCRFFKKVVFFPGYYVVQRGDFDNTMYFIHHGEVHMLSVDSNLMETVHEVLHSGDVFGAKQGLFHKVPYDFSYRAHTTVHVLSLHLGDWEALLDFFPQSKESIFIKANRVNV